MRRGTTPIHYFEIPFEKAIIKTVKIIYSQNNKTVLCKNTTDCEIEDGKISVRLTQEETLLFSCKAVVNVQVRILTKGGDALASDIIKVAAFECLDDGVLE